MTETAMDPRMQKLLESITRDKETLYTYSLAPTIPFVIVPQNISEEQLGVLQTKDPEKASSIVSQFGKNRNHLVELMKQAGYDTELSPTTPDQSPKTPEQILLDAGFTRVDILDPKPSQMREQTFRAPESYRELLNKLAQGVINT